MARTTRRRKLVVCDQCRQAHRRCSGDGPPCTACCERPYIKCTFKDGSSSSKRSMSPETAPISGTKHASETIPEGKNGEVPRSTVIEDAVIPIDGLFEQGAHEARRLIDLPTTNQYLLVLSYLFLASRVPYDDEAISHIIARDDKDWENNFHPQYPRLLSWWNTLRGDLTQQGGILAVSIEDMIQQMSYLLYLIGRLSSRQSSPLYSEWESLSHPSRPFGMNASIALICYCFNGTKSVKGYESLDIWLCNEGFLVTMLVQLKPSPTFRHGISLTQLKNMIASLRKTLEGENKRVFSLPWSIRIDDSVVTLSYYQRAIKALNPELLPELQSQWVRVLPLPKGEILPRVKNWDFDDRAMIGSIIFALARLFQSTRQPKILYDAIMEISQLMESNADRKVAFEMMHVREWERLHQAGLTEESIIRVVAVPP